MARISTYNIDPNITADDKWIGTDFNTQYTKNFTPQYLADFFNISNSIGISGQVSFKYYSIFPGGRPDQSITTPSVNPNFSTITSLKIHKNSGSGNYCIDFINYLSGDEILISDTSNADIFGHFKLNSVTQDLSETNFYNLNVTYIGGNGNLQHLKVYSIALYSAAIINPSTPNLQQVTNVGATTTNNITCTGIINGTTIVCEDGYIDSAGNTLFVRTVTGGEIGLTTNIGGEYTFPDASGTIALLSNIPAAQVNSNWNATSGVTQILNKPTIGTWGASNYPIWTTGTPFVKMTAVGTFALDTTTYLSSITSLNVTTALGYTPVTNARTLTINGVGYDLTADRSWTIATGTGTVTSVGMTVPSAFSVTPSSITTSGTFAITGAGVASQYVRGDGTLANFPTSSGGGASVSYYLNGSVSQGTLGGVAYKEINSVPIIGTGTGFTINADGYIAQFITDVGDPNKLLIPAGNWNFETYFSASSGGGSPSFYIELYKYNGATFTLITSNSATPENITGGTSIDLYFTAIAVPPTTLLATDRLAVRFYVIHSGRTITMHTENSHLSQIITTFSTGLTTLNGLTDQAQYFAVGTGATNFNISSSSNTHTFNLLFNIRRNANNSSNNNINYNGYAVTGSAESSAVWTIKRLTIAASGAITVGTATNVTWTNRESATYI